MRIIQKLAVVAVAGVLAASCDVHRLSGPGTFASLAVTPATQTLAVTGKQQFTAAGFDFDGGTVAVAPTWTVVAGGGTISSTGLFTASTAPNTFTNTVMATYNGKSATATIIVVPGPLAFIAVTPGPTSLAISTGQQFVAVGTDAFGNVVPITPNWSVIAAGGTVTSVGMFTSGTATGVYTNTVQASSGLTLGTATVTVTPGPLSSITVTPNPANVNVGATQQFTAVGNDASGNVVAIAPVWTNVTAAAGSMSATGLFTAGATPGAYPSTARAAVGAIAGSATVNVTAGALASITITPNPSSMAIGATQQFTAVGRDVNGNVVAITPSWAVVNGGGTIGLSSGLWTAGNTPGTYTNTVRATSGAIAGFQTVTVSTGPLATITVTPSPVTVQSATTQQFTAVGRDAGGNILVIAPTWSATVAAGTITASGLFTASAAAATYPTGVTAQSGAVSGSAVVTVSATAPVLTTITVLPNPANLQTGQTQQFAATGRDQNNNPINFVPTWSVFAGGGVIDPVTGLFVAGALTGTFTNTVRATSGAVFGSATVVITSSATPPPLVNLGTAALNGIMAGTAFTCVIGGIINADIAISPGNTVTGFPPCQITGVRHLNDLTAIQNQIDLTTAYNQLAGMPCPPANFISANLGGTTMQPGVYCSATSIGITGTLTLDALGNPNANFVFQAGSSLITAGNIVLINGAQAKNVYFQVGSSATLGTASQIQGNILALTSITLVDNATLIGRALARNGAVSLGTSNVIILP